MKNVDLTAAGEIGRILQRIDKEWMLLTAGTPDNLNTMTASWGGIGVLWGRPMATIFVRPERYTYQFVEEQDYFSIAFFPPEQKTNLTLCGSKSGRDIDKVQACNFTVASGETGGVYFKEADLALICRKLYRAPMEFTNMQNFTPADFYSDKPGGGLHTIYMGEIVEIINK